MNESRLPACRRRPITARVRRSELDLISFPAAQLLALVRPTQLKSSTGDEEGAQEEAFGDALLRDGARWFGGSRATTLRGMVRRDARADLNSKGPRKAVGDAQQAPPQALDAAIVFAPAGELVPPALAALDRGGTLVLAGIHMSPIPSIGYAALYHERVVRTVANNTRDDARAFLAQAASIPVRTHVREYAFEAADRALHDLSTDAIRGAAVLRVASA